MISILESLAFAGLLIPGLVHWEVCFTFTSVIFLPWPILLAVQQYRGSFRCHPSGAAWALGLSCIPLPILTVFTLAGFTAADPSWRLLTCGLLLLVAQTIVVLSNWNWLHTLNAATREGWWPPPIKTVSVLELLLLVTSVAVVLTAGLYVAKPLRGISVSASATPFSLPQGTHDVTYDVASYYERYECTVEEKSFLTWFDEKYGDAQLESIEDTVYVQTFVGDSFHLENHAVTNGWQYRWRKEDQGVSITFDRQNSRLYYDSHTR